MATIRFTKMHGAGNDYIYVDTMKYPVEIRNSWPSPGAALIQASAATDWC